MKIVKGDLLKLADKGEFDIIVHGCNCFHAMNSGIAGSIKEKWPETVVADKQTEYGSEDKIGNYSSYQDNDLLIVNAYTQYNVSANGEDVFEYYGLIKIFEKLYDSYPDKRYGLPKIGCGLANGDEEEIMGIINYFADKVEKCGGSVTVVEYEPTF